MEGRRLGGSAAGSRNGRATVVSADADVTPCSVRQMRASGGRGTFRLDLVQGEHLASPPHDAALLTTRVYGATVEIVQANGLEIAYERVGEGRSCSYTLPPRTVASGGSSSPPWPTSSRSSPETSRRRAAPRMWPADFVLPAYANCLSALIEALELEPAHVAASAARSTSPKFLCTATTSGTSGPPTRHGRAPHPPSRHAPMPHGVGSAGRVAPKGVSDARSGR
jgi:hypothetical protein